MTSETSHPSSTAAAASARRGTAVATRESGEPTRAAHANGSGSATGLPAAPAIASALPRSSARGLSREAAQDTAPSRGDDQRQVPSHFGLRRADQIVAGLLVFAVLGLAGVHWARLSGWGTQPVEIERLPEREYEFRLEINAATWIEWVQLPDIGETLAKRIVADRERNGPFGSLEELDRVHGIGPKTIERLRPWLRVAPPAGTASRPSEVTDAAH
jgi:competence protein ComEA